MGESRWCFCHTAVKLRSGRNQRYQRADSARVGKNDATYCRFKQLLKVYGLLEIQIEHGVEAYYKFLFLSQTHSQFCRDLLNTLLPFSFENCADYTVLRLFCEQFDMEAFYDRSKPDIDFLMSSIDSVARLDLLLVESIIDCRSKACIKSDLEDNDIYDAIYQEVYQWNKSVVDIIRKMNERFLIKKR